MSRVEAAATLTAVRLVVADEPEVRMMLPAPLRVGDKVHLQFEIPRQHKGRTETLHVDGDYRVATVAFHGGAVGPRQRIAVEPISGVAPHWVAIPNQVRSKLHKPVQKVRMTVADSQVRYFPALTSDVEATLEAQDGSAITWEAPSPGSLRDDLTVASDEPSEASEASETMMASVPTVSLWAPLRRRLARLWAWLTFWRR